MLTQAQWANFTSEMMAIREKVDLERVSKNIDGERKDIFTEKVPVEELSKSLKQEMLYIIYGMKDDKRPKDYEEEDINFFVDEEGNVKGYHYIRADLSDGESKKYIYDEEKDVIYKVKATNILGTKVHTYEYACKLKGTEYKKVNSNGDYIIKKEASLKQKGGIAYYEPDLENFKAGVTSIVYYKKGNLNETKEIPSYLSGATDEVKVKNDTYIWYDYSQSSKMWANVKCESANELVSYWVWIPRYAYKIDGSNVDIKFITIDNKYYDGETEEYKSIGTDYVVGAAFEQGGNHLKGIWMSKYEPSKESLGYKPSTDATAVNAPDLSNFNEDITYYVTYGDNGNGAEVATPVKGNSAPDNWYDYTQKRWANIKCENETANGDKITSYWVWIPRYASRVSQGQVEIIYIDENNNPLDENYKNKYTIGTDDTSDFKVQAAFEQNNQHLKGIWVAKYEPSDATKLKIKIYKKT